MKNLNIYIVIIAFAILLSSCEKDITACFTASTLSAYTGDAINFSDCSKGGGFLDSSDPANWSWDFGDGLSGTGSSVNHSYSTSGTYTVTLSVKDADGDVTGTTSQSITISVPTGNATFWYNSSGTSATVIVNGSTDYITSYYPTYNPTCGSTGCANFTLPEGTYYYYASSTWSTWSGNITVTRNQCTLLLLQ